MLLQIIERDKYIEQKSSGITFLEICIWTCFEIGDILTLVFESKE